MYMVEMVESLTSVVEPWHFGTDPDPGIRTTDLPIRILLIFVSSWQDANKK